MTSSPPITAHLGHVVEADQEGGGEGEGEGGHQEAVTTLSPELTLTSFLQSKEGTEGQNSINKTFGIRFLFLPSSQYFVFDLQSAVSSFNILLSLLLKQLILSIT